MTDPDRDKIAKRHPSIKQDSLFPITPDLRKKHAPSKQTVRSIRTARCPQCCGPQGSNKKIGVIRTAIGLEVFRQHDKFTIGGLRIPCSGSGSEAGPST